MFTQNLYWVLHNQVKACKSGHEKKDGQGPWFKFELPYYNWALHLHPNEHCTVARYRQQNIQPNSHPFMLTKWHTNTAISDKKLH